MTETLLEALRRKAKSKKGYTAKARCTNCLNISEVIIPFGTTIEEYFENNQGVCEHCKCNTLEKLNSPIKQKWEKMKKELGLKPNQKKEKE